MKLNRYLRKNAKDLSGRTVVVTGSTGGLGNQIVKNLAMLNANIILLDRDLVKGLILKEKILKINNSINIRQIQVDFLDLASVSRALDELNEVESIDALILNAGVYKLPLKDDGEFNDTFKVNFISPFYIAKKLLPKLKKSTFAKIVVVGSIAYKFVKFNEDDIDYSNSKNDNKIYGNSKRFLMLSMYELFKNEKGVSLSVVHPGITGTNITRHFKSFTKFIIKVPMKIVFNSPYKASLCVVKGLFDETSCYEWIGPKNFDIWGNPAKKKLKEVDEEESKKIFDVACEIYNEIESQKIEKILRQIKVKIRK